MACLTADGFFALLPDFTGAAEPYLSAVLGLSCSVAGPGSCWGALSTLAQAWLTAHYLTVGSGGETGMLSSQSIDSIAASYTVSSFDASDAGLASTKWGRMYLAARRGLPRIGAVVGRTTSIGSIGGCGCG